MSAPVLGWVSPPAIPHTGPLRPASDISRAQRDLGYEPQFADLDKAIPDYRAWVENKRY